MSLSFFRSSFLVLALVGASGCTAAALAGEECVDSADCDEGLSCFNHQGAATSPVCMPDCDLETTRLCGDGTVCTTVAETPGIDRPANLGVCYLGGTTAVGSACTTNLECTSGSICVNVSGAQTCYPACLTTDDMCAAGSSCVGLEDMGDNGFCEPSTEG
ncbi:MAG: hypothetical protein AB8I08_16770 [Sandaracinaceae bacterium]